VRGIAILVSFLLFPTIANAYDAPFGLRWGMAVGELAGVVGVGNFGKLTNSDLSPGIKELKFINAPKTPSNTEFLTGEFTDEAGLIGLSWTSTEFTTNDRGSEGYKYYLNLKNIITEKYKPQKTKEHVYRGDIQLDDEPYMLFECLSFDACEKYRTYYTLAGGGSIQVDLHSRGRGRVYATIEYKAPNWFESVMEKLGRDQKQKEQLRERREKVKEFDKESF